MCYANCGRIPLQNVWTILWNMAFSLFWDAIISLSNFFRGLLFLPSSRHFSTTCKDRHNPSSRSNYREHARPAERKVSRNAYKRKNVSSMRWRRTWKSCRHKISFWKMNYEQHSTLRAENFRLRVKVIRHLRIAIQRVMATVRACLEQMKEIQDEMREKQEEKREQCEERLRVMEALTVTHSKSGSVRRKWSENDNKKRIVATWGYVTESLNGGIVRFEWDSMEERIGRFVGEFRFEQEWGSSIFSGIWAPQT